MTEAYIGLGSNMGDRLANLAEALSRLAAEPDVRVGAVSRVVETEPWGVVDQPPFANAVARIGYRGEANVLLETLKAIEKEMGRVPGDRFASRPIDLDILLFGDEEWGSDALTIPHPRLQERVFVVVPLLEIAPGTTLPDGTPVTAAAAWAGRISSDLGVLPGFAAAHDAGAEAATDPDVEREPTLRDCAAGEPGGSRHEGSWVAVGPVRYQWGAANTGTNFDLLMYESFLTGAGIPVMFLPHRPNETLLVHSGLRETVRLMVPDVDAERARRIIADLDTADHE